ncbi:MAG: exodeoxyribonuclease III [Acidimicrobiales bacterium]|jgi:exodeoxyribonuclease-3|nr:exodeoxyribonuclease III [Actinomycetota bacterium]
MRIATWNVNSLKARIAWVEEWIGYASPDVLCLQETKLSDAAFPAFAFSSLGYESAHHGDGRWNGVAVLSRVGLADVERGLGSKSDSLGCRLVAATCGGVRVISAYAPNGREVGSEHYHAKLEWFAELRDHLASRYDPGGMVALCGDLNVAPADIDVWDPGALSGSTHVSDAERLALAELEAWGLEDVFRQQHPEPGLYSWWDYRDGAFHRHRGMRIDLVLMSRALAGRARFSLVDRNARKALGEAKPSDHAPVFVDVDV